MPEVLFYSHMTFKVHLKDLLAGKLPYYPHTPVNYAHGEKKQKEKNPLINGHSTLAVVQTETNKALTCYKGKMQKEVINCRSVITLGIK